MQKPFENEEEAAKWLSGFMAQGREKAASVAAEQPGAALPKPTCGNCAFYGQDVDYHGNPKYACFANPPGVTFTDHGVGFHRPRVKHDDLACRHHKRGEK